MRSTAPAIVGLSRTAIVALQLVAMMVLWTIGTSAFGFSISAVEANHDAQNSVVVAVDCDLQLSPEVIEALESNIPITIMTNIKLYQVRDNLWDKLIFEYEVQDEITYRSLYRAYRLSSEDVSINADYPSLARVLNALCSSRIHQLVLNDGQLDSSTGYRGKVKILLDRSALPSVMRLPVFFKNAWRLQSTPFRFDIQ